MRHRLLAFHSLFGCLALPLVAWLAGASPAAAQSNPFNADGYPAARGTYGSFPYEQVDPLSGNLIISVTDLSLPGPIPLSVSRSYNSKFHKDFEHNDQSVGEWSPLGVGWRMHFGRVLHAESTSPGTTSIEGTDGGGGALYQTTAYPEGWITKRFVRYNRQTNKALAPNGLVYTFGHVGSSDVNGPFGIVRYLTEIRDQFNNTVTFHYDGIPGLVTRAHQTLNATQSRDVYFVYNSNGTLTNIQYGDRVWTFQYDPAPNLPGHTLLRKVLPPAGLPWEHQYGGIAGLELTALLAPGGGRVDYTYSTVQRRAGSLTPPSRVVSARAVGGRAVTPGTWTFSYNQGANLDTTVVACPCGTTSYRYNGIGISGNFSAWASGTMAERQVRDPSTGAVLEQETITYGPSAAISPSPISGEGGQWGDTAVYNPLTVQRVLTRSAGGTWTTTFEYNSTNYNDFGRPFRTTEQGDLTRISGVTFQYGFTPWIIGGPSSTSLRVLPGSNTEQTSSTTYDLATGLVTSSTAMGVTTTFTSNANGTVASATNANGHTTQYVYDWGVVAETRNPILWTVRGINSDGTVASELVGNDPNAANNLLTTYGYDAVGRLRWVQPRNANIIRYTYEDVQGNLYVQVDRGTSQVWTHLDGFGRVIRTVNSLGVQTRVNRDGCGRAVYASGAYTTGDGLNRGTTTTFDWLGRAKEVSVDDPSGTPAKTTYTYTGTDVAIADAIGRSTTYHYLTFGSPGDGRLMSVTDAAGVTTSYQYDMWGHLTQVNGPGAVPPRSWSYNVVNGRLVSESQPESGPTSYTYDALGNIKTVTDAAGRITRLTYDADERLTDRATDGDATSTLHVTYDLVGRVRERSIPGVTTSFTFDNVGRVASRTDGVYPSMSFTSSYSYDGNDNLTQILYPCRVAGCTPAQRRSVTYEYDVEYRLTNVRNNGVLFAQNFTYDNAGRLATYQTGAVTHRFDYDTRDRVSRLRAGPTSGNALDLAYSYNQVSQVLGITDGVDYLRSQSFGYDALDRLIGALGPWGLINWTYDAAGNRLTESRAGGSTDYTYHATTRRLMATTGSSAETFDYTPVGEVRSDSQGNYTYSPTGMLLTASRSGMSASYLYGPDQLRVKRVVNNATVITVRGAGGQVLSELSSPCGATPTWERDNIYAGGKLLGAVRNGSLASPTLSFAATTFAGTEGQGLVGLAARLTLPGGGTLPCAVTVAYDAAPIGTTPATPSLDYTLTPGTLTFPAGSVSGTLLHVPLTILGDPTDELDETLTVRLTSTTGGVLVEPTAMTVTLVDDDPPPSLSISSPAVNEIAGPATFTLTLSAPTAKTVSVGYATVNGTATAGSDFSSMSGTVTIPAGAQTALVQVPIINDTVAETQETFTLALSNPVNVTLAASSGTATIISDEVKEPIDPSLPGRYFAEMQSSPTEAGYILIFNPHTVPVTARLTFTYADGSGKKHEFTIPAQKRFTYDLALQAVGNTGRFSVAVQSTDIARPLVSEHSGYSTPSTYASGRNDTGAIPAPTWYFAEGAANSFFSETLRVFNPTNDPLTVTISIIRTSLAPLTQTFPITTGPGRVAVHVETSFGAVGDHGTIVSAVSATTGQPANIVVQRTIEWPKGAEQEMATSSGAPAPGLTWYFGEGGKGAWSTFVSLMNPSASQTAEIAVYYTHDNGQTYTQNVSIPPQRRVTVSPPASVPDGGFAIDTGTYNYVPYVVERSMYTGPNFAVGGSSAPATGPAGTWRFAEGASNSFFDTYFAIFNPSWSSASTVTMTFRKEDNTVATHSFTVGPRQRWVVSPDGLPSVNGTTYATEVVTTNGVGIVVERAMYWPQGGWNGSHLSLGVSQ